MIYIVWIDCGGFSVVRKEREEEKEEKEKRKT